jgi:hypothetical protein
MQQQLPFKTKHNPRHSECHQVLGGDFIPFAIKTYGCFHPHFDSILTSCVHTNITRHQQTSLVPLMFISYYRQQMLIARAVQAIAIF